MPNGAVDALKEELTRRISKRYDDVEVIVKATSNDGLSVTRTADKDSAKTFVQETLKIPGSLLTSGLFTNKHVIGNGWKIIQYSHYRKFTSQPQHVLHTSCLRFFFFAYIVSGSSGDSISGAVDVSTRFSNTLILLRRFQSPSFLLRCDLQDSQHRSGAICSLNPAM